MEGGLC